MKTENKNQKAKITKKGNFLPEELKEIEQAMVEEGFTSYPDFVVHMVRTRKEITDAEQRRMQVFNYHHARIHTLHNMMMANIEPRKTMNEIMMEVDKLCQELV